MNKAATNNRFVKAERLSSKRRLDLLFQKGSSNWEGCLRMTYLLSNEALDAPIQIMFSVPKRQFRKAVDRNLLKRRMRESYRTNKHDLYEKIKAENKYLLLALLYVGKEIEEYVEIESRLKRLLTKIQLP
jgi:ribonuclease P protein component